MSPTRRLVVTGASTGFGRAIAESALKRGWKVLGTVRKDSDAAALQALGVDTVRMDLAVPDTIATGCAEIEAWASGRIDAVVHNAGSTWPGPIELLDMADLRMQFEVNVFGHIDVTQRLLPSVRAARGRMLYISSDSTTTTPPMVGAYAASKRAIEALAESLAQETMDQGIQVIVVAPGPYQTAIWGTSTPRGETYLQGDDPRLQLYKTLGEQLSKVALGRPMGDAADLATVVLDALDHPRPAFRYVAPFATRVQGFLRGVIPTRTFHKLTRAVIARG